MSSDIKRYELYGLGQMNQRDDSRYITYEDHEKAMAEAVRSEEHTSELQSR